MTEKNRLPRKIKDFARNDIKSTTVIARFFAEKSWQSIFCHAEFISASPRYFLGDCGTSPQGRIKNRL